MIWAFAFQSHAKIISKFIWRDSNEIIGSSIRLRVFKYCNQQNPYFVRDIWSQLKYNNTGTIFICIGTDTDLSKQCRSISDGDKTFLTEVHLQKYNHSPKLLSDITGVSVLFSLS